MCLFLLFNVFDLLFYLFRLFRLFFGLYRLFWMLQLSRRWRNKTLILVKLNIFIVLCFLYVVLDFFFDVVWLFRRFVVGV